METINAADGNNSFTHCASTTVNMTSSSQSQSTSLLKSTPSSLSSTISRTESAAASAVSTSTLPRLSKPLGAGAIAGIVVGIIAFVGAIALFFLWLFSHRRRQAITEDLEPEIAPTPFTISDDSYSRVIFLGFLLWGLTNWVYSPVYVKQCWNPHAHNE